MNIEKLSNEYIEDLFQSEFDSSVASLNNISSFECKCVRTSEDKDVFMEVTIFGFAGSPSMDDFKKNEVEKGETVSIDDNDESLEFILQPEKTYTLSVNDYVIIYILKS